MDREWVKAKTEEQAARRAEVYDKIKKALDEADCFKDSEVNSIMKKFKKNAKLRVYAFPWSAVGVLDDVYAVMEFERNVWKKFADELYELDVNYGRYLDSDAIEFDGDIIITDPCYVTKDDDWYLCNYGSNMEILGIKNYVVSDTIYGDWSCTVFDEHGRKLGNFCADAGMVAVFSLDEVLKYNPAFDYHLNREWTTAWIKNFKGVVQIVVEENEDGEHSVHVIGNGIDKVTGEKVVFRSEQTGF